MTAVLLYRDDTLDEEGVLIIFNELQDCTKLTFINLIHVKMTFPQDFRC